MLGGSERLERGGGRSSEHLSEGQIKEADEEGGVKASLWNDQEGACLHLWGGAWGRGGGGVCHGLLLWELRPLRAGDGGGPLGRGSL